MSKFYPPKLTNLKEKMIRTFLLLLGLSLCACIQGNSQTKEWHAYTEHFCEVYRSLRLPGLQLSFIKNLANLDEGRSIQDQLEAFTTLKTQLNEFTPKSEEWSVQALLDYQLIDYEITLNLMRIQWALKWKAALPIKEDTEKMLDLPFGKEWYEYSLKRWLDLEASPDAIFAFGKKEIQKVKQQMKAIQESSGMDSIQFEKHLNDPSFFYTNKDSIQQAFEVIRAEMNTIAPKFFPFTSGILDVEIERGTDSRHAQVPAFYRSGTFYYNLFDEPFNKRQIKWFFMHEGVPGHHYEVSLRQELPRSSVQRLSSYGAYAEGWAAYIETIGWEIGLFDNIYDDYGRLEWDLIRSVRVPMDVGINYYGWDDDEAMAFWKTHISNQDHIGQREIARMKRWPCQVVTYKYGADKLLKWKAQMKQEDDFDLKDFHQKMLEHGPMPYSILEDIVFENKKRND
ncbi:MAG: DUF885 domain-containing protein [Bacteroidota bacterium]